MPAYDKAADYRRRAQETRAVARQISLNDARQQLFDDAARLEALAEIEERQAQQDGSFVLAFQAEEALLKRAAAAMAETSRL